MTKTQVYALGRDIYWLEAMARIAGEALAVTAIPCPGNYPGCLDDLPPAEPGALLLVDATNQGDIPGIVQHLRQRGWAYVVVVAADPSWKEATEVLRGGAAYDYWPKSYKSSAIRGEIERCLAEIQTSKGPQSSEAGPELGKGSRKLGSLATHGR